MVYISSCKTNAPTYNISVRDTICQLGSAFVATAHKGQGRICLDHHQKLVQLINDISAWPKNCHAARESVLDDVPAKSANLHHRVLTRMHLQNRPKLCLPRCNRPWDIYRLRTVSWTSELSRHASRGQTFPTARSTTESQSRPQETSTLLLSPGLVLQSWG